MIKNVMRDKVITVKPETPLKQAIELLISHKISGLPVVDEGSGLLGMITEKDLLNILSDDRAKYRTVEDLMVREVRSFQVTDSLDAVCDCLLANNFRRVPILEGDRLVGLVSRADLMSVILELVLEKNVP